MRAYNAVLDRWGLVSMNQRDGLENSGTGHFENSEMRLEQKLDPEGGGLLRIRYHDITPDHSLTGDLAYAERFRFSSLTWLVVL